MITFHVEQQEPYQYIESKVKGQPGDYYEMCVTTKFETVLIKSHLQYAIVRLRWMHLACFFLHAMAEFLHLVSRRIHFGNVLLMISVPLYQTGILIGFYEVVDMEKEANKVQCMGIEFGRKRSWIYFEIFVFYINIVVLMLFLICKIRAKGGGKKLCDFFSSKHAEYE